MATKLDRAIKTQPDKLRTTWEKLGGNYKTLTIAVGQGFKKKRLGDAQAMLGAPMPAGALVVTASPILIKIGNFLKSIGINPEQIVEYATEKVKEIASNKIEQINEQAQAEKEQAKEDVQKVEKEVDGEAGASEDGSTGMNKTILLVGAGAVALFLFTRKR